MNESVGRKVTGAISHSKEQIFPILGAVAAVIICAQAHAIQPIVAVHDSELTRALETMPASGGTPAGPNTTGFQWWQTDYHYFVMPESVKEALRSDGTAFTTVSDSDIASGLIQPDGTPKYPIVISLATEAATDGEIARLKEYVSAGGFVLVGSSAFTRNADGTSRGDFAIANEMGIHMVTPGLQNWAENYGFNKVSDHRLTSHIPSGYLTWRLAASAEEISWGISPAHPFTALHDVWQVQSAGASVLAGGDNYPYLSVQAYGNGYFIYCAALQPLVGHGGFAPGMYSYMIFRHAIEWAFEHANTPIPKVSPWPYQYNAAMVVRHDLEDFQNEIADVEASAQFEALHGAKGDYYFCTGTLREEMAANGYDTNAVVAGLRRATVNYGATIEPHNGGLRNPNNPGLVMSDYDYWHWGPDEALDITPPGYASGKAYALDSMGRSFNDVESWLSGVTNGVRGWVGCYFNATREDSLDIQETLGVKISGDQKLSPFPHWTISTRTPGKHYSFLSEPVSDWFVGGLVAQSLEPWHPPGVHTSQTMHDAVDFYYNLGGLINLYSHTLATGEGGAGTLTPEYITYSLDPGLHPNLWSANALGVYQWWQARSNVTITAQSLTNGGMSAADITVHGASDPNTAVEVLLPGGIASNLQVLTNGVVADASAYRIVGQTVRVRVGTSVNNVKVGFILAPSTVPDYYSVAQDQTLTVANPGLLANDSPGMSGGTLTATLVSPPLHGAVSLNASGAFVYTPTNGFSGSDLFTYTASNGQTVSAPTIVIVAVKPTGALFADDFTRATDPGPLAPWSVQSGAWTVTGGVLEGGPDSFQTYGYAYSQNWTNYAVQGRIRFPAGAYGGALGGRLDSATGAHYAAWVYPEGSSGGSSLLKLVKFQTWTSFGYGGSPYAPMAQVNLPGVGTNWHDLKIAFFGPQIAVYYDGANVLNAKDNEFNTYLSGGITADMWTDLSTYSMTLDDVAVYPEVADDSYRVSGGSTVVVNAPGVLANDTPVFGGALTATLVTPPTNGVVVLQNDGSFVYTPGDSFAGVDSFVYQATDSGNSLGMATVNLRRADDLSRGSPPMIQMVSSSLGASETIECSPATGTHTNLFVTVADSQGDALQIIWTVNGIVVGTNQIAASGVPATNTSFISLALPLGVNNVSVSVSDGFFPPVSLSNTVTIVDTAAPVPTLASLPILTGSCSVTVTSAPTASDACAGLVVGITADPLVYSTQGTNLIHWMYRDGHGNSSQQIQTVIVKDVTPPAITKGSIAAAFQTVAQAQAAALAATTATDNCGAVTMSVSTTGSCSAIVVVTATDAAGNQSSVNYSTKILNGAPVFAGLPSATATLQCYGDLPPRPAVTAADVCGASLLVAFSQTESSPGSSSNNIVRRAWAVTDSVGNSNSFTQTITIRDTTVPTITKGSIAAAYQTTAQAQAAALAATTAFDNCGRVSLSVSATGACSALVTVVATDAVGNQASVSYSTRILSGNPVFVGLPPATATLQCYGDLAARPAVTAADVCGTPLTVSFSQTESNPGTSSNNIVRRTWVATDAGGNSNSFTQTITVKDLTPPMIACPANVTNIDSVVVCSFTPSGWGAANPGVNPGTILLAYFSTIYPAGVLELGKTGTSGSSAKFNNAAAIRAYLGASGAPGALNADLVNPTTSSAGTFGPQVLALQLNVDFGDAGAAAGMVGSLGDMMLSDSTSPLNGKSVRQILGLANTALGGGTVSGLSISNLNALVVNLNKSFDGCQASDWALGHLLPASGTVLSTGTPVVTDNCDQNPIVAYSDVVAPGLCPGSYTIFRTWKAADSTGNSNACVQIISLGASTASICGRVAFDCNGNRSLIGDDGIPAVGVVLKNSSGLIVRSAVTDRSGKYCFTGLGAGTYRVVVAPPANYLPSVDPDGVADNTTSVSVDCDGNNGVDFGYYGAAPAISITQTGPASSMAGATVTFSFAVTNTGNSCLSGVQITDSLLGGVIFTQSTLAPQQGFAFSKTYVVKATDPAALSSVAVVTATPALAANISAVSTATVALLSPPVGLTAIAGNAKASLSWNPIIGATSYYSVKRSLAATGPFTLVASGINTTNYSDMTVSNNVLYYYALTQTRAGIESALSSPVSCLPSAPLPSPWNTKDIGSVAAPGAIGYATNKFVIVGSGADIWGTSDSFRYLYQLGSGDGSVVARVLSITSTDPWAKAGVMIRESLAANSSQASTFVTAANGVAFQYRAGTGAASGNVNPNVLAAPYWVKIVRTGNAFASYSSVNGSNWALIGVQNIPMASTVYIGLGVTSHNDGTLCTAVFDNITATP